MAFWFFQGIGWMCSEFTEKVVCGISEMILIAVIYFLFIVSLALTSLFSPAVWVQYQITLQSHNAASSFKKMDYSQCQFWATIQNYTPAT